MMEEIEVKRFYYPSSKLRAEISFINGIPHGRHREWHENGVLAFEGSFKNEVPDGIARQWDESGKILCTYEIKDGTGVQRKWFASQGFWGEISWVNGAMTGRQRMYLMDGTVVGETFWIKDRKVSKKRYFEACRIDPNLPRYDDTDQASPLISVDLSQYRENGDEFANSILSRDNTIEALQWLKDFSAPDRSLGEASTREESIELIESLYSTGAKCVWVFDITGEPSETQNSGRLIVQLPENPEKRKLLLRKCNGIGLESGFDAESDCGQRYMILMLD